MSSRARVAGPLLPLLPLLALLAAPAAHAGDRVEGQPFATRSVVYARHGMVAAAHPLAVQAGLEILRKGGSAADAAIAVNAALAVVEPVACGLGGDLFALAWTRSASGSTASTPPGGRRWRRGGSSCRPRPTAPSRRTRRGPGRCRARRAAGSRCTRATGGSP
jgi:hypothetical protein